MVTPIQINMANDLGYGSVKTLINNHSYLIPSTSAILRKQDQIQPTRFDHPHELSTYINNFMDHLDVSIQSPQVKENRRMFVGKEAIRSRLGADNFNVNNYQGKSETDLALILTLSAIAGETVQTAYQQLPTSEREQLTTLPFTELYANVNMATALPIAEAQKIGTIDRYQARFLNHDHEHLVIIHNFEALITVHVTFKQVEIADEGETALYKIRHANASLSKLIEADFLKAYPEYKDQLTDPSMLTDRNNAMVIDIGEGTTDFAVFTNRRINEHASSSLKQGFGNVLEAAIADLQQNGVNITNRSDLQQQLSEPENIFNANLLRTKKAAVKAQLEPFQKQIIKAFGEDLNKAGSNLEIIYVLGGGATPMNQLSDLRAELIAETKRQTGNQGIVVIFINELYAQLLNEAGLKLILDMMTKDGE